MSDLTVPSTAKAVSFSAYGEPVELRLTDTAVPKPGPGQVLLRVAAAAVNPLDWKLRRGFMQAVFPVEFPHIPGLEAAGTVVATGPGVDSWQVGDEVFGSAVAAYAEYALAEAATLAARPADLPVATAAGLPVAAETAVRALGLLDLKPGETLLVHGAAGSVATLAVQFAVADGIRVIGTAGERDHQALRELGAVPVLYGDGVFDRVREAADGQPVAAVLHTAGDGLLADSVALVGGPERVLTISAAQEAGPLGVRFTSGGDAAGAVEGLSRALALHAAGTLSAPVRTTLPLADAPTAHRLSEQGGGRGKIVLLP
ncbi:NADP-dependent oxidoreductase [Streptacidiphilus carbonis]|uniref:NADP-dependent oxidoreductase n=1 Tax=Streptacidiphilus carbonis TaxID=105422 RepID=UPI0005AB9000|nr:NADP-dependent oxidoreductase [Streptacidiphilus carbonis]